MRERLSTRLQQVRQGMALPLLVVMVGAYLLWISPQKVAAAACTLTGLLALGWVAAGRRGMTLTAAWLERSAGWLGLQPGNGLLLVLGTGMAIGARAAAGDGARLVSWLALPLWLVGIACTALALRQPAASQLPARSAHWEWIGLAALTLLALGLRTWKLASMPYVLSGDEGSAGLSGMEFVQGVRNNPLGLGWFSFPSLYFWMLSGLQLIFGRTTFAIRSLSALAGALTIPAVFWMVRGFFGRRAGWLAALWLTCFHAQLFFSRIAYNNIFDGLTFTLSVAALWRGVQTGRRNAYLLAGLLAGISQYFYTTAHLIPLLLAAWLVLIGLQRDRPPDLRPNAAAAGVLALSVAMPLALLYLAHPQELLFTSSRVSMLVPGWIGPAAAALGTTPLGLVLEQTWVTALGLSAAELQGVYYGSGVPLLFGLSTPLFYIGLVYCLWRLRDPRCSLPLLTLGATVIVGGLSIQAPNAQRMLLLPPVLAMLVILPLDRSLEWIASKWPRLRLAGLLLALALVIAAGWQNIDQLFRRYFPREQYGSLNGQVTMGMIETLRGEDLRRSVYFVGGERMYFDSIPSLPYLLPAARGIDLAYPYQVPSAAAGMDAPLLFFILPEQTQALEQIHERYPHGVLSTSYNRQGQLLFYLYRYPAG